jgi:hypothetical protein
MPRAMGSCRLWGTRTGGAVRGRAMHPRLMIMGCGAAALRFGSVVVSMRQAQALHAQGARAGRALAGHAAHTLDDGGPHPLRAVRPRVCPRLARVVPTLDEHMAHGLGPCLASACPVSVGPSPEVCPQYCSGIVWPRPHHGGVARPHAGAPRVSPGAPEADHPGRAGDAAALSPVRDASVATACPGHYAGSSLRLMAGSRAPGIRHPSVPAVQRGGRRAGEAIYGTEAATPRWVLRGLPRPV